MSTDTKRVGCAECNWRGWLHSKTPFEIQRCDTCNNGSDEDAAQAHRRDCGCDWPETDYQAFFQRISFLTAVDEMRTIPKLRTLMNSFHDLASERASFAANVPKMAEILGEAIDTYHDHWVLQEEERSFYNELQTLAMNIVVVLSLILRKQWREHWTWDFEDGVYIDWKWYARKPAPQPLKKLPLIQASASDAARPSSEYLETTNRYLEKIRALGATVTIVHDEFIVDCSEEVRAEVQSLMMEMVNYQLTEFIRHAGLFGPLNIPVSADDSVAKEWKNFAEDSMAKTLKTHAPKLMAAMEAAKKRKPKIEFDYKKVYTSLSKAEEELYLSQIKYVGGHIEEAKRLLLEAYPDADEK